MSLSRSLLVPLTLPYGLWVRARAVAYRTGFLRKKGLEGTVISVGNLTVGGTGKTPMVLWIARKLLAEGKSVGVLTRGYRGSAGSSGGALGATSDEVQLLRVRLGDSVLFGVGPDRAARGRELARHGVNWFVLDDGFQHQQLARDVNIVLVDASNPFGGGRLLPAGRLREPKSSLSRAGLVVITRSNHAPALEAAIRRDSNAPIFYARVEWDSVRTLRGGYPGPAAVLAAGRKLFAFCGIGNPPAFLTDLQERHFAIVGHRFFRDHHRYTPQDTAALEAEARKAGADALICTEKDAVNLSGAGLGSLDVFYGQISLHIDREEEFWRTVMAVAKSGKPSFA